MKRSNIIEARRAKVSPEVRRRVDLSFLIADRIHCILEEKGLKQKDLLNVGLISLSWLFCCYSWTKVRVVPAGR